MDREEVIIRSIKNYAKREQGQTSLVNKEFYGQKITPKNFAFVRTKREIPGGQDRTILPARVANQNTGFTCLPVELVSIMSTSN